MIMAQVSTLLEYLFEDRKITFDDAVVGGHVEVVVGRVGAVIRP